MGKEKKEKEQRKKQGRMNGIISHGPLSRGSNIFDATNAKIAFLHFWLVFALAEQRTDGTTDGIT